MKKQEFVQADLAKQKLDVENAFANSAGRSGWCLFCTASAAGPEAVAGFAALQSWYDAAAME